MGGGSGCAQWHLGFCDERYTPTFRGFDSFLGFLNGVEDYFSHTLAATPSSKTHAKKWHGVDFRNGSGANVLPPLCNTSHGSSAGHSTGPAAAYSSVVLSEEAARLARHHTASRRSAAQPLFVYLPFQSVRNDCTDFMRAPIEMRLKWHRCTKWHRSDFNRCTAIECALNRCLYLSHPAVFVTKWCSPCVTNNNNVDTGWYHIYYIYVV
jgi:hypothetical protein